jgi:uncharacterized protein (TIGR02145 family)
MKNPIAGLLPLLLIGAVCTCSRHDRNPYESADYNTPPQADFTVQPLTGDTSTIFTVNAAVSADAEDKTEEMKVRWGFNGDSVHVGNWDKDWSYAKQDSHHYTAEGTKTIWMEVKDAGGMSDTIWRQVVVSLGAAGNTPPTASFTVHPETAALGEHFYVDATASSDQQTQNAFLMVRWDWESDSTWDTLFAVLKTSDHIYTSIGLKTIRLEVLDLGGLSGFATRQILVTDLPTVTDQDGIHYKIVTIGGRQWMAENLRTGIQLQGPAALQTNNGTIEVFAYQDRGTMLDSLGGLYQWDEAMQYQNMEMAQGICPSGWQIPSDDEWKSLEMALGMTASAADSIGWRGTDQGTKLRVGGSSGFNALLTGTRSLDGFYSGLDTSTVFWTSSQTDTTVWLRMLNRPIAGYGGPTVLRAVTSDKKAGACVRCIKK